MDSKKKTVDELEKIFAAGDAWLRRYGIVDNPVAHNSIILNLYANFPKVRYVEYFLGTDPEDKKIKVVMHFPFWTLLFLRKDKTIENVVDLLRQYLFDYEITVELRRYKKGVEKE